MPATQNADPLLPFGSRPDRPRGPLYVWGALYAVWFLFVLYLALRVSGAFHSS
ncbi:MAG: hypothetical protein U1D55_01635 [Phycisphaerae bacterium]